MRATFIPKGIHAYFDKVQAWLKFPADRRALTILDQHCGKGGLHIDNKPARFGQNYRQRIELKQPSLDALQWLAERDGVFVNRFEVTLDCIFDSLTALDQAQEFLHFHLIRRWHSKKQQVRLYRGSQARDRRGKRRAERVHEIEQATTRYDASRRSRNGLVIYTENHSRVTGELYCLHVEWRANGVRAVQSVGTKSAGDLLEFDHHAFWKRRLLLVDVDPERLGRLFRNRASGLKSRSPVFQTDRAGRQTNMDQYTGSRIIKSVGSLQELLDAYGTKMRIRRILEPVSNSAWLPASTCFQRQEAGDSRQDEGVRTEVCE
jgi:hypothetical protein